MLLVSVALLSGQLCMAQKFSVSTDVLGYADLCTFNVEGSYALSRHWSLVAGARYNPFTFRKGDPEKQFQNRQQSYSAGVRYWPWHVWSGWWFATKLRYQEYNTGGILSRTTKEGDRLGGGIYGGYTHMLTPHLNIEFGVGLWGGYESETRYSCPLCGRLLTFEKGLFIRPDDISISLVYVF